MEKLLAAIRSDVETVKRSPKEEEPEEDLA